MNDLLSAETNIAPAQPEVPEKFRDPETGEIRLDALLSSYHELEKKLSRTMPAPETENDKTQVLRRLGAPETPEEYEIDTSHGLFETDPDVNRRLCEKGFTPEQAQAVYDIAAEKFVPLVFEIAQEFKADREIERLVAAFGGPEKWKEVSRQLLAFGKKNLPPEVLESLAGSFEGVMMLHKMMKAEDTGMTQHTSGEDGGGKEGDLREMMRDPRYWRDKDPAFVEKVTAGFQKMYGN